VKLMLIGQGLNREAGKRMRELKPELRAGYARRISLTGAVGRRMAQLAGISFFSYLRHTDRRNLLDRCPGKRFPCAEAFRRAESMREELCGRRVIFMGRMVATAFGCAQCGLLKWYSGPDLCLPMEAFAILPHPSGLNRWWNRGRHTSMARKFLREAFREVPSWYFSPSPSRAERRGS